MLVKRDTSFLVDKNRGHALDPIARVDVVYLIQHTMFMLVNVTTDDTIEVTVFRKTHCILLEVLYEADRRLHVLLNLLREREVGKTSPFSILIVERVHPQEPVVSNGTYLTNPLEARSEDVQYVAVEDEIAKTRRRRILVFFRKLNVTNCERYDVAKKLVMVAWQPNNRNAARQFQ